MVRPFSGQEYIEATREQREQARSVDELRQALAVLLPLELGVNLEQVALVLRRSKGATCTMRTRFMARHKDPGSAPRSKRQLRTRAKAIWQQEAQLLDKVLSEAAQGAVVVVPPLKTLLEEKLGKSLSLTTLYNMLHRHGWRKPAPDTAHPQGDPQAREDWKKNSPTTWHKYA
jgi:transposase